MNLTKLLKRLMPLCLAFGCIVMFDSCTEDFCEGTDCGPNATCNEELGTCSCDPGWVNGPDGGICNVPTECFDVDCGNGNCQVDANGVTTCICDDGWFGANCAYDNPCDDPDVAPCPENSTCEYQQAQNADGTLAVDADGNPIMEDVCVCDSGYELVDVVDENGEVIDQVCGLEFEDFLGNYIQRDTCSTGEVFDGIQVEVVLDDTQENGIILDGFAGLIQGGHPVRATFSLKENGDYEFVLTPDSPDGTTQTVVATDPVSGDDVEATFEALGPGTIQAFPDGTIFMTILYRVTSAGSDECIAVLTKQ